MEERDYSRQKEALLKGIEIWMGRYENGGQRETPQLRCPLCDLSDRPRGDCILLSGSGRDECINPTCVREWRTWAGTDGERKKECGAMLDFLISKYEEHFGCFEDTPIYKANHDMSDIALWGLSYFKNHDDTKETVEVQKVPIGGNIPGKIVQYLGDVETLESTSFGDKSFIATGLPEVVLEPGLEFEYGKDLKGRIIGLDKNGEWKIEWRNGERTWETTWGKEMMLKAFREGSFKVIQPTVFKVGDLVRVKAGISSKTHRDVSPCFMSDMDKYIGKEMKIERVDETRVVTSGWSWDKSWLEPVPEKVATAKKTKDEDAPKFKIGDMVRVRNDAETNHAQSDCNFAEDMEKLKGKVFKVTDIQPYTGRLKGDTVRMSLDGDAKGWSFIPAWLEPVWKVGDRVKAIGDCPKGHRGVIVDIGNGYVSVAFDGWKNGWTREKNTNNCWAISTENLIRDDEPVVTIDCSCGRGTRACTRNLQCKSEELIDGFYICPMLVIKGMEGKKLE
jgi:hypothetical protein